MTDLIEMALRTERDATDAQRSLRYPPRDWESEVLLGELVRVAEGNVSFLNKPSGQRRVPFRSVRYVRIPSGRDEWVVNFSAQFYGTPEFYLIYVVADRMPAFLQLCLSHNLLAEDNALPTGTAWLF